jgi:hypothetical protein
MLTLTLKDLLADPSEWAREICYCLEDAYNMGEKYAAKAEVGAQKEDLIRTFCNMCLPVVL